MGFPPLLSEFSPFYLLQLALTIWMLVDANRRGVEWFWFWIILFFQPLGPWIYFFLHKARDFWRGGSGTPTWASNLFTRRPSLEQLRFRAEQSPTMAARLELAERLVEVQEYQEAEPHLKAVLAREPEHSSAAFNLVECLRQLGRPAEAIPPLLQLVARQPNWRNYRAWHTLIATYQEANQTSEAVAQARKLAQVAPSLEHKCLLARCLTADGGGDEARQIVEKALQEYQFSTSPSPDDRRWVGKAKQLLAELG